MSRSWSSLVISRRMMVPLLAPGTGWAPIVHSRTPSRRVACDTARSRTSRRLDADLRRRLVRSHAAPARVAQAPVAGPFPVADLTHQLRLHERHTLGLLAGKWFIEG